MAGVLENLHIQDGELITQPTDAEACFGVTESGEFLSSAVKMEANVQDRYAHPVTRMYQSTET